MSNAGKFGLVLLALFVGWMAFDYYVDENHDIEAESYTYTAREGYDSYKRVSADTVHYSQKSLFLISDGGTIDATCDDGYSIVIESQDNFHSGAFSRLYYTFSSRADYDAALAYMAKKGYRWIVNYQFGEECKDNRHNKITFEPGKTQEKHINSLYLSTMKGAGTQ